MKDIQVKKTFALSPHSDCACQQSSDCHRCVLNLLQPYLKPASLSKLSCVQRLLQQFKDALDQEGVISLNIDGQIQFITQTAQQLLNQYFSPCSLNTLPMQLQFWFQNQIASLPHNYSVSSHRQPLSVEKTGKQLLIYLIPDQTSQQYLLFLEEQPQWKGKFSFSTEALETLGLTRREAEVLFWIPKDKSNAGIARVLGCCEGTVRKHLENLYKKLGVQTRIGAVMVALEKLGLLQE